MIEAIAAQLFKTERSFTYRITPSDKGLALASIGRHEEAIACYKRTLEIDPKFKDATKNLQVSEKALLKKE